MGIWSPLATWCRMTKALFSHQNTGESRDFIFCLKREEFLAPLWLSGASLWALNWPTASGAHMTPRAELLGRWDLSPPWSHSGLSLFGLLVNGSQPQSECRLGHTQWSRRPTSRCVLFLVAVSVGDSPPRPRTLEQPGHVRRCPLRGFTEFTSRFLEGEGLTEAPSSAASSLWPHQQGVF